MKTYYIHSLMDLKIHTALPPYSGILIRSDSLEDGAKCEIIPVIFREEVSVEIGDEVEIEIAGKVHMVHFVNVKKNKGKTKNFDRILDLCDDFLMAEKQVPFTGNEKYRLSQLLFYPQKVAQDFVVYKMASDFTDKPTQKGHHTNK